MPRTSLSRFTGGAIKTNMKKTQQPTRSKLAPSNEGTGSDANHGKRPKPAADGFEFVIQMPTGAVDRLAAQLAALDKKDNQRS